MGMREDKDVNGDERKLMRDRDKRGLIWRYKELKRKKKVWEGIKRATRYFLLKKN